jgi:hypothetical protein
MNITFLSRAEAQNKFSVPDEYARSLPAGNLSLVNSANPTIDGYQQVFLDSFADFSAAEQSRIVSDMKILDFLNIDIKVAKTRGSHSLDIPHTRDDVILITGGRLSQPVLVHEVYHIISRKFPEFTDRLSKIWNFKKVRPYKINDEDFTLNPDAMASDYAIAVTRDGKKFDAIPYIGRGFQTFLKPVGRESVVRCWDTNYQSLVENTSYLAHPEEICAEHFAIILTRGCVSPRTPYNVDVLAKFRSEIIDLMKNAGIASEFPAAIQYA